MYVDQVLHRYLKENRLNLLDNDHDHLENYHPKRRYPMIFLFRLAECQGTLMS